MVTGEGLQATEWSQQLRRELVAACSRLNGRRNGRIRRVLSSVVERKNKGDPSNVDDITTAHDRLDQTTAELQRRLAVIAMGPLLDTPEYTQLRESIWDVQDASAGVRRAFQHYVKERSISDGTGSGPRISHHMAEPLSLRTDGPHSSEYTKQVADALTESMRVLNHATLNHHSLQFPSDVAYVVSSMATAVFGMEQLSNQLSHWLESEHDAGRVGEWVEGPNGGDADAAVDAARLQFEAVRESIQSLADRLNAIHSATNVLEGKSS